MSEITARATQTATSSRSVWIKNEQHFTKELFCFRTGSFGCRFLAGTTTTPSHVGIHHWVRADLLCDPFRAPLCGSGVEPLVLLVDAGLAAVATL